MPTPFASSERVPPRLTQRENADGDRRPPADRELPGFVAFLDGQRVGLASYAVRGDECELVTMQSLREGRGVGRALLDAVRDAAVKAGCTRLWLITTNDNVRALEL